MRQQVCFSKLIQFGKVAKINKMDTLDRFERSILQCFYTTARNKSGGTAGTKCFSSFLPNPDDVN